MSTISAEDIQRISARVQPFPLPGHMVPGYGDPFANLTDQDILDAPPHLITHLMRTAAQGGFQVVSPRQTPMSQLMCRVTGPYRELGDHVVGSVADPADEWPTLDDATFEHLLPDQPLATESAGQGFRDRTRTEPLTSAPGLLSDPILACLVKGRAVIDILRRPDVAGDGDALAALIAEAWGIPVSWVMDLDAYTLGVDGPLLRHAIKVDDVYPTMYAPVHVRGVVSVGATDASRDYLPFDTAMDWRRMRTLAEAVFVMSCEVEGTPIRDIRCFPAPGDPTGPLDRPNTIAFRPAPCTAWSFAPSTFTLTPAAPTPGRKGEGIPRDVLDALLAYTAVVKPVSYVLSTGSSVPLITSNLVEPDTAKGETLAAAYARVTRLVTVRAARGRGSSSAVRSFIYTALASGPPAMVARLARSMVIVKDEIRVHFGLSEVPDSVIDRMADRFVELGANIEQKVAAEASRRGQSGADWWEELIQAAPQRYKVLAPSRQSWARLSLWLAFRSPNPNWQRTLDASHYGALRAAAAGVSRGVPLPPKLGSPERALAALSATAKAIGTAFSGYYMATSDVALAMADVAQERAQTELAQTLREAGYLWALRARSVRGTNVHLIDKDEPTPSVNHLRLDAGEVDAVVAPAPYYAYEAYKSHVSHSPILPVTVKIYFQNASTQGGRLSDIFRRARKPLLPARASRVTRYLLDPERLGNDMEKAWRQLREDLMDTAWRLAEEARQKEESRGGKRQGSAMPDTDVGDTSRRKVEQDGLGFFDLFVGVPVDDFEGIEAAVDELPDEVRTRLYAGRYASLEEFLSILEQAQSEPPQETTDGDDAVY